MNPIDVAVQAADMAQAVRVWAGESANPTERSRLEYAAGHLASAAELLRSDIVTEVRP